MNIQVLTGDFTLSSRGLVVVTFLTSGTLAWFFLLQVYLDEIFLTLAIDLFWANISKDLFFGVGVFSAIVGSLIAKKVNRNKFLMAWITLGIISTISLVLFQGTLLCAISGILLGLSLGLGLPSCLAFLSDSSTIEERGRVAGITILESFVMAFITLTVMEMLHLELLPILILVTVVRSISFLALLLDTNETINKKPKQDLVKNAYSEFVYYLIPWIMFVVAATTAINVITAITTDPSGPQIQSYESVIRLGNVFRYAFIAIFGFLSGIVIDRVGRKQTIIIGLISLGIGFALLGSPLLSETIILVYFMASGIAWGSFLTVFLVVPGDLSISGSREMFYAFGTIGPLIVLFSFSMINADWLNKLITDISPTSFSQILSVILFISIVPVMRAKETLTESKKQKRKLKEHIERVVKLARDSEK